MQKAKRSKKAQEEEDTRPVIYTLHEMVDTGALTELAALMSNSNEVASKAVALLEAHKATKIGTIEVKYRHGKDVPFPGRVYASVGLQNIKGFMCRIACHTHYVDIDIRKCAPTCLLHVAVKYLDLAVPNIQRYVARPDDFIEQLRSESFLLQYDEIPSHLFKMAINAAIHTGSYEKVFNDEGFDIGPLRMSALLSENVQWITLSSSISGTFASRTTDRTLVVPSSLSCGKCSRPSSSRS